MAATEVHAVLGNRPEPNDVNYFYRQEKDLGRAEGQRRVFEYLHATIDRLRDSVIENQKDA